jgi:hypothetical protein
MSSSTATTTVTVSVRWQYSHVSAELHSGQDASILARLIIPASLWECSMDASIAPAKNESTNRPVLYVIFLLYFLR